VSTLGSGTVSVRPGSGRAVCQGPEYVSGLDLGLTHLDLGQACGVANTAFAATQPALLAKELVIPQDQRVHLLPLSFLCLCCHHYLTNPVGILSCPYLPVAG